jgi:ATP-dependent DNA helicase MPH1
LPPTSPSVGPSDVVVAPEPSFGDVPPSPSKGAPDQETSPETKEPDVIMEDDSLAWLLADSDDAGAMASSPPAGSRSRMLRSPGLDTIEIEDSKPENGSPIVLESSPVRSSGPPMPPIRDKPSPPVPPLRLRLGFPSPVGPSPSLPVRAAGQAKRRPVIAPASDASSPLQLPPPSQKRLHRRSHSHDEDDDCSPSANASPSSHHPPKKKRKLPATKRLKVRDTAEAARAIPWIDVEAIHSGDEVSGGGGLSSSQEDEGESLGGFVTDLLATQPPASYDQSAVYRQSLLSQAPVRNTGAGSNRGKNKPSVPVFAAPPARRKGVPLRRPPPAAGVAAHHERRVARFSSPVPPDEEDYYSLGSFVVDDEAEISFTQSSEP